jgi:hypothetical protein
MSERILRLAQVVVRVLTHGELQGMALWREWRRSGLLPMCPV